MYRNVSVDSYEHVPLIPSTKRTSVTDLSHPHIVTESRQVQATDSIQVRNMKLIIVGASGFVATELISQALRRPDVTNLVALSRKPVTAPDGENAAKLKSVVISDYGEYPDDVKKELAGANACIWYGSFSQL